MTEILFESSFKILLFGLFLAVPLFIMAWHFRDRRLWIATGVVFALIVAALITERIVETPVEQVKATVSKIAQAVEDNDTEELVKYISPSMPETISRARFEMKRYNFTTCRTVMFHEVKEDDGNPGHVTVDFMVRFNLTMGGNAGSGWRDVILSFKKESDGEWRIVDYSHHDPTNRPDGSGTSFFN